MKLRTFVFLSSLLLALPSLNAQTPVHLGSTAGRWQDWSVTSDYHFSDMDLSTTIYPYLTVVRGSAWSTSIFTTETVRLPEGGIPLPEGMELPVRDLSVNYLVDNAGQLFSPAGAVEDNRSYTELEDIHLFWVGDFASVGLTEPGDNDESSLFLLNYFTDFEQVAQGSFSHFDPTLSNDRLRKNGDQIYLRYSDNLQVDAFLLYDEFEGITSYSRVELIPDEREFDGDPLIAPLQHGFLAVDMQQETESAIWEWEQEYDHDWSMAHNLGEVEGNIRHLTSLDHYSAYVNEREGREDRLVWNTPAAHTRLVDNEITRLRMIKMYQSRATGLPEPNDMDSMYRYWLLWSEFDADRDTTDMYAMVVAAADFHVDVDESTVAQPTAITLHPAYPNPFNASTVIPFELNRTGEVRISVVDMLGRNVAVVQEGVLQAGLHRASWQPAAGLASGTYLVRLEQQGRQTVRRVQLLK